MSIRSSNWPLRIGLVALLLAAIPAQAQQPPPPQNTQRADGIGIGIKGGPLLATIDEVDSDFANRNGFIGGLFLGGNRNGTVGVGVDLLYARKGGKDPDGDTTLDLDYINVPVYARINLGSASRRGVSAYGTIGADLNFLLKAEVSNGGGDVKDEFERADYGVAAALGVEITRLIVEFRFTRGLGNIAKDKDDAILKTQTVAVMIGVRFN